MGKVKKAIIIVAGLNSRMMPIAKTLPKCLFPLGNKPVIQLLVEECVNSGLKKIIIVTRKEPSLIKDYFTQNTDLESILSGRGEKGNGALERLKEIDRLGKKLEFVTQAEALGECHALYQAKKFVDDEPVAFLYGDYFYVSKVPAIKQLVDVFNKKPKGVIEADARYVFDQRAFRFLKKMNFLKLGLESIYPLVAQYPKNEVREILINGTKCDIGSPKEYWKTLKFMLYQERI